MPLPYVTENNTPDIRVFWLTVVAGQHHPAQDSQRSLA